MSKPTSREWIRIRHRNTNEYIQGVRYFMEFAKSHSPPDFGLCSCPCIKCRNSKKLAFKLVEKHLIIHGMDRTYDEWFFHGERSDNDVVVNTTRHNTYEAYNSNQFQKQNHVGDALEDLVDDAYRVYGSVEGVSDGNHWKKYQEYKRKANEKL